MFLSSIIFNSSKLTRMSCRIIILMWQYNSVNLSQQLLTNSISKILENLLSLVFSLPTVCLLHFNLLIRSFVPLKLLFSNLIMTSTLLWITSLILLDLSVVFDTSYHSYPLTRLQNWFSRNGLPHFLVLILSHISTLSQSPSMILYLHSIFFSVVYPKVLYFTHYLLLFIIPTLARFGIDSKV